MALGEVRHALEHFVQSNDRKKLSAAIALLSDVERQAKDVTKFASTVFEFGLCDKMNAGLNRFAAQLTKLASEPTIDAAKEVHELEDVILAHDVLPYSQKYLDFNEEELADRLTRLLDGRGHSV